MQRANEDASRQLHAVVHGGFLHPSTGAVADATFADLLSARRAELLRVVDQDTTEKQRWIKRSYPVLAVVAPVLSTHRHKIEFPGDPMCLYAALSIAMREAVAARDAGLVEGAPYNDVVPRWGCYPSDTYRQQASDDGIRSLPAEADANTDTAVFDPRVWNAQVEEYFRWLLAQQQPRVILVSSVSPALGYAIQIMQVVREVLPSALIVCGGRHMDETVQWDYESDQLVLTESNLISAVQSGLVPSVVDFTISGDGYYAVDFLMKAISLTMNVEDVVVGRGRCIPVDHVVKTITLMAARGLRVRGKALICAVNGERCDAFPINGTPVSLAELPSPYRAFHIRARFPVFADRKTGKPRRTAHINASRVCPYHCEFCSEGAAWSSPKPTSADHGTAWVIERTMEVIHYGAESVFFDDSILLSGDEHRMREFAEYLLAARKGARTNANCDFSWIRTSEDRYRLEELEWGAQVTVGLLLHWQNTGGATSLLRKLREAGCTYMYLGIESMCSEIMEHIHKAKATPGKQAWAIKVKAALQLLKDAGIRAGASVLFGLPGETKQTIDETLAAIEQLLSDGLLFLVSPNIMTYHPGTELTRLHNREKELQLDRLPPEGISQEPYCYFEEAFPGMVSKYLNEDLIWHIHRETLERWKSGRNMNPMSETRVPPRTEITEVQRAL